MNPMASTSKPKTGLESLLLPQVVYDRKGKKDILHIVPFCFFPDLTSYDFTTGGRFYNKLESWWNRPSRLQQAAEELVYEDASLDEHIEMEREIGLWEWL